MKVFLACRDGPSGVYLAQHLHRRARLDGLVIESGQGARQRKMRRLRRDTAWWRAPVAAADLVALALYSRLQNNYLRRFVGASHGTTEYPTVPALTCVHDINEPDAVAFLRVHRPEVLVVSGTALLGEAVLALPSRYTLNVHGGIVPQYRNVHSEFWAYWHRDLPHLGTSVIHLDAGIDTGDVAAQATVAPTSEADGLFGLKARNLALGAELVSALVASLDQAPDSTLPRTPQGRAGSGFYPTPGCAVLLAVALRGALAGIKRRLSG